MLYARTAESQTWDLMKAYWGKRREVDLLKLPVHAGELCREHPGGGGGKTPPSIWAKRCRFVIFSVFCLLAFGDTALKS